MILEFSRQMHPLSIELEIVYVLILLLILLSSISFIRGFILLARKEHIRILKVSSYALIVLSVASSLHALVSVAYNVTYGSFLDIAIALVGLMIMGAVSICCGIGILKLQSKFGILATRVGVFEIVSGACFLLIFPAFIGVILLIPLYILSSMLLFRAAGSFDVKRK